MSNGNESPHEAMRRQAREAVLVEFNSLEIEWTELSPDKFAKQPIPLERQFEGHVDGKYVALVTNRRSDLQPDQGVWFWHMWHGVGTGKHKGYEGSIEDAKRKALLAYRVESVRLAPLNEMRAQLEAADERLALLDKVIIATEDGDKPILKLLDRLMARVNENNGVFRGLRLNTLEINVDYEFQPFAALDNVSIDFK